MNTWLPITVGWANAEMSPSKPNAHFSFNRETCSGVSLASAAGAKRELFEEGLQPFQIGDTVASIETERSRQNASGRGIGSPPGFPRNRATASRSARFNWYAMVIIAPKSRV